MCTASMRMYTSCSTNTAGYVSQYECMCTTPMHMYRSCSTNTGMSGSTNAQVMQYMSSPSAVPMQVCMYGQSVHDCCSTLHTDFLNLALSLHQDHTSNTSKLIALPMLPCKAARAALLCICCSFLSNLASC